MALVFDEDKKAWANAASIAAPATQTASYVQADAQSIVTAVNAILAALRSAGIIATD